MICNCFIFARGGSKGLAGKNIKKLAGKPLIVYSIEAAFNTPGISNVFVSTDDEAISQVALNAGAIVINRPSELAQDNSSEWLAWQHAIEWVNENYGKFDCFISLPTTSPLRSVKDITSAMENFINDEADVCISVTPSNRSPYFNMVQKNKSRMVELVINPDESIFRRQDAPEVYDITTVVYVSTPKYIMNNNGLFSGRVTSVEVPKERAVDIDDKFDFMFAEKLIDYLEKE